MFCIRCGKDTQVVNSRPHKKSPSVWRRRRCKSCGVTYTTWETVREDMYMFAVRYPSGSSAEFSFARLLLSLHGSMRHRDPQTSPDDAYWLTTTIAQEVQATGSDFIDSNSLAYLTFESLSNFDKIAGLSYGAQHNLVDPPRKQRSLRKSSRRP